jgi:uncharacterized MAPEG superfamily protein
MRPISIEIAGLLVAVGLGIVHIVLASHSASLQRGYRWSAGARDEPLSPLSGVAGRLSRACSNYLETFPFFAALALGVVATGAHSAWSTWGVCLYLAGRLAYLPLYAFGVFLLRSLVWNVAVLGIALLGVALVVSAAADKTRYIATLGLFSSGAANTGQSVVWYAHAPDTPRYLEDIGM